MGYFLKLGLPIELATEMTYLQYYIETILAIQSRYANPGVKLPLCIMVSNDTNTGTTKLLEDNDYFGMEKDQIFIVQQGDGVPALQDNNATIAISSNDSCKIEAKPHGHGDIHALLYSKNIALDWCKKKLEWVIFFQDTNGLAFHTLPLALGVSKRRDLIMNSIAVPRKAKQAIGGIAKLVNKDGQERLVLIGYD
jgi:UDP-sugar pyrophosphorylase